MAYTVGIVSLGCAKNRVDAEMIMYNLRKNGFILKNDPSMCDVAIINTCGFIESAKQESIEEIIELATLKNEGKIKTIIVTGCLAERYKEEVMEQLPEVDAVIGIGENENISNIINDTLKGKKINKFPDKLCLPLEGGRIQSTEPHWAYIKIAEGCDNCCTYCAIPSIRGKFRSRKLENIVEEAKSLAEHGVKELNVIAQDTSRYGEDNYNKPMLPTLLKELCKIDKLSWIRVLYCYPDRISDELLDVMSNENKIVKYLDLPLQHCNKHILKNMNRRGDFTSIKTLIKKIRKKIPNIVLRTTLITGFPGETDEQFEELSKFVNEVKFERLGCFAYSQEEGTIAGEMPNQIEETIKNKRAEIISEQQALIMEDFCKKQIGKTIKVLVDGYDKYAECFFGRSIYDAPEVDPCVFFTCDSAKPHIGEFVNVKITDYIDCDLVGKLI